MEEGPKVDQIDSSENVDSTKTVPNLVSTSNTPSSHEFSMGVQEKEAIENMLSIVGEGFIVEESKVESETQGEESRTVVEGGALVPVAQSVQDHTIGVPHEGPDPSSEDPTQGSSQEPQERSVSREEKRDSEEDSDDLPIASLTKRRPLAAQESTPKRPTTRLQRKEALESALKNNQAKSRRRKLVKDEKVVSEKSVPVVNVDEEEVKEPGSLTRKLSQKHGLPKPKRGSSMSAENLNKSDDIVSSENVVKKYGDKYVEESGAGVMEELGEKSVKYDEKGKNVCKSAKRKADTNEEPGSSKKARVGDSRSAGKERLRSQKVYEEEVQSFYADLFKVEDDHICVLVNGVDMVMESTLLGSILGVPAEGLSSVQGSYSQNFRNAILKDKAIQ
uniref:Uncharacterized protein LOC104234044 n=1 Tax=Nicotiana sylvestris TaxID=4096 RepID=A0A1U7XFW2_NICSY|nr:PREDICTED: uncharacterized protein LOC104234044 [Nicotiana sylvestris]